MMEWMVVVWLWLIVATVASAALMVKVAPPKTTGGRTIIQLDLKNTFTNNIESVRAVVFLLDDQGKMAGQAAYWIIGGAKDKPGLASDQKTTYNFVVTTDKPFTKTKVMVNRLILENSKQGDPIKDVQIFQTQ